MSEGRSKSHFVACGRGLLLHWCPTWGSSDWEGTWKGCPGHTLESPATLMDNHLPAPAFSKWQRRPAEERGGSGATATGNHLQLAAPRSGQEQPRSSHTSASQHSSPRPHAPGIRWGSCLVALVEGGPPRSYLRGPAVRPPPSPPSQPLQWPAQ